MKIGPSTKRKLPLAVLVFVQHVGAGDVRGHQVGRELNALEAEVENPGQRADHQRLGQARHAYQQAVAAGEDGREDLLDDVVLADDDLLQLLLHQLPMLAELLQDVAETAGLGGQTRNPSERLTDARCQTGSTSATAHSSRQHYAPHATAAAPAIMQAASLELPASNSRPSSPPRMLRSVSRTLREPATTACCAMSPDSLH